MHFPCDKCGLCCRQLSKVKELAKFDRGDGTCIHFDENTLGCMIYNNRPLICNIQEAYKAIYYKQYTWEEFVQLNQKSCLILKEQFGNQLKVKDSSQD